MQPPISQERPGTPQPQAWLLAHRETLTRLALISIVAAFLAIGLVLWLTDRFTATTIGYPGIWVLSFLGAASLFIPGPGLAAVCLGASPALGLSPLIIGVLAGSAEALGETTGYMAGLGGKSVVQRHRFYPYVHRWMRRRGGPTLFSMSLFPNPLFDVIGIAAGSTLYPIRRFLLFVFVGKAIKSTAIAYGCFYSIGFIQDWLARVL